ncbi:MAG: 4Fe-4S binding protein [Clostridia bacterium]|jgi:2-oxoglutarate ferredoxin oxidoreductase subunit delta|nr:4Fe-4S binding protein [Clostridia bacterium]MCI1959585.1 4Fe-4S binding protein [Clostridia bacterium]MCI2000490.1 4Fe-4S binding protein [Clostridia bacterium]MCI2014945.1 4Fe-4S binding protein [Clostridia bacterium]
MNRVTVDREMCKECEYCLHFCPKGTILKKSTTVNKMGYYPAEAVDMTDCIACGICASVCPEGAITVEKNI